MLSRLSARFELLRPRTLARTNKSVETLATEVGELRRAARAMSDDLRRRDELLAAVAPRLDSLAAEVRHVSEMVNALVVREAQLRAVLHAEGSLEAETAALPSVLDEELIVGHMRNAVAGATLCLDPFPHAIVEDVFPRKYYAALLRGLPPGELFGDKTLNKEHVKVPLTLAPSYSRSVWNFLVFNLQDALRPLLLDLFRAPIAEWLCAEWPSLNPDPFAPPMKFHTADGRIMRRGRGYYISPHRDPKWGFLTGILYLARPDDDQRWGTQLFAVDDDDVAVGAAPHWITRERCRLVVDVPYRPNTMLVMLNSHGAHGAHIPEDAEPADLQRHIYQFRIGPSAATIRWLTTMLTEDQRQLWAGKVAPA